MYMSFQAQLGIAILTRLSVDTNLIAEGMSHTGGNTIEPRCFSLKQAVPMHRRTLRTVLDIVGDRNLGQRTY
jgi:hypothetical protein